MIMHFLNYNALTMHDHSILSNLEEQTPGKLSSHHGSKSQHLLVIFERQPE